ncbi:MAG: arylsulfatase, partial [Muribaculaceae bacterium]|nr:arylsulfatase [Muribaculaceae bacterium]
LPTLTGDDANQKKHDYLYWEFHETDMIGVREGDWKLVVHKGKCRLYNLAEDIHEDNDVAALYPEVVERMKGYIREAHTPSELFKITLPE